MQILEAFRALNALNEDVFSLDADGVKGLSDFKNNDDFEDDISIIDPEAETADDLQDNYIGKVILDCCVCHSKLYKAKEEVNVDESGELANVGEECPYCFTPDGFKVIGEVAAFDGGADKDGDGKEEGPIDELLDANISLDASGSSVGFLGGTGGSVANESLKEGIFDKFKKNKGDKEQLFDVWCEYNGQKTKVVDGFSKEFCQQDVDEMENTAKYGNLIKNGKMKYYMVPHAEEEADGSATKKSENSVDEGLFDMFKKKKKPAAKQTPAKDDSDSYSPKVPDGYVIGQKQRIDGSFMWTDMSSTVYKDRDRAQAIADRQTREWGKDWKFEPISCQAAKNIFGKRAFFIESVKNQAELDEGIFDIFKKKKKSSGPSYQDKVRGDIASNIEQKKKQMYTVVSFDIVDGRRGRGEFCVYDPMSEQAATSEAEGRNRLSDNRTQYQAMTIARAEQVCGRKFPMAESLKKKASGSLAEDIQDLSMTANDTHLEVSEDDSGKVTVSMEPVTADGGEMIAPVSDETEAELLGTEEEVPEEEAVPSEEEEVDVDVEEVDEESVDELGESYFRRTYENVSGFKTTAVRQQGNSLIVEGKIRFNNGKVRKTSFMFEALDVTRSGKVRFVGDNRHLTEGKKAFVLTGKMKGNKLIAESLNYNYKHKDANGKVSRVYGTERTSRR